MDADVLVVRAGPAGLQIRPDARAAASAIGAELARHGA
jgi:hypothetical protein